MWWWWPFGNMPEMKPRQVQEALEQGQLRQLIDVRSSLEYAQGHISGARSVPIHKLPESLAELDLDPECPILAICKTAHRSVPAVRLLRRHGYNAHQLAGGMDAWRRAGLPEIRRQQ